MDFKTNSQDKSNLVGDEKLMSDAVDVEQELIRVKQENRELKEIIKRCNSRIAALESIRGES